MEVHHHPHVHKKNFKEYFLEGMMIFFAVSLGFMAESIREKMTNQEKEEILIESLIQNLKKDTANLNSSIQKNLRKNVLQDSLLVLTRSDIYTKENTHQFYAFFVKSTFMALHIPSDAAIVQLKTDGGMSLISKEGVMDSILNYENEIHAIERHNLVFTDESDNLWKAAFPILDVRIMKDTSYVPNLSTRIMTEKDPPAIIHNDEKLKIFYGVLTRNTLLTSTNRNYMVSHRARAERLIEFLHKTYHIEE